MNQVNCTGNIAKDALLKLDSHTPLLTFPLAVNVGYGEKRSTIWYSCALFGKRSEKLFHLFKKGRPVNLSGQLTQSEYLGKDGSSKKSNNLEIDRFTFLDSKLSRSKPSQETPDNYGNSCNGNDDSDVDDGLPF